MTDEDDELRAWIESNLLLVALLSPLLVVLAVFQLISGMLMGDDR